jgi:hypothetical protein
MDGGERLSSVLSNDLAHDGCGPDGDMVAQLREVCFAYVLWVKSGPYPTSFWSAPLEPDRLNLVIWQVFWAFER